MTDPNHHIEASDLAAYVDGALVGPERTALEEHLADCAACREELVETVALVRDAEIRADRRRWLPELTRADSGQEPEKAAPGRGSSQRGWWVAAGAAAAVVATLLLMPPGGVDTPAGPDVLRDAPRAGDALATLTPSTPEASVGEDGTTLTLSWDAAEGDLTYRLTVTDQEGATLATRETTATSVTLDPIDGVTSGSQLFWYVDATLPDGETATTGVQTFVVP